MPFGPGSRQALHRYDVSRGDAPADPEKERRGVSRGLPEDHFAHKELPPGRVAWRQFLRIRMHFPMVSSRGPAPSAETVPQAETPGA
jgi:hypothetical protein